MSQFKYILDQNKTIIYELNKFLESNDCSARRDRDLSEKLWRQKLRLDERVDDVGGFTVDRQLPATKPGKAMESKGVVWFRWIVSYIRIIRRNV